MKYSNRGLHPATFVGLAFLTMASVARFLFAHYVSAPENLSDFVLGALYGVAIAAMLLGIWRKSHQHDARRPS